MEITSDVVIAVLSAAMAVEHGARQEDAETLYRDLVREWTRDETASVDFVHQVATVANGTLKAWRFNTDQPRKPGEPEL